MDDRFQLTCSGLQMQTPTSLQRAGSRQAAARLKLHKRDRTDPCHRFIYFHDISRDF